MVIYESIIEDATLELFWKLGYSIGHGGHTLLLSAGVFGMH